MKCLVTGAGGFIGSHLCEKLVLLGHEVHAFVHYNSRQDIGNLNFLPHKILKKIQIIKGDIQDPFYVESAIKGRDYVFHLAALIGIPYSYLAPAGYVSTNVFGTLNVLEAVKKHKVKKMIHTSTSEVYGTALSLPINEKHPLQGQSPYSASKIGADQLVESYFRSFEVPVTTIRPFNTFGPRQSSRAVIPTIIVQLLCGSKKVRIGSLYPTRDFNYVKDTVNGYIKIAFSEKVIGRVFNIGSGKAYTVKETFNIISDLLGSKAKIINEPCRVRPEKSEVQKLICDYSQAQKTVGYAPEWNFENGLRETIKFFKRNLRLYGGKEKEYVA